MQCKRLAELKLSAVLLTRKQFGQRVQVHSLIVIVRDIRVGFSILYSVSMTK